MSFSCFCHSGALLLTFVIPRLTRDLRSRDAPFVDWRWRVVARHDRYRQTGCGQEVCHHRFVSLSGQILHLYLCKLITGTCAVLSTMPVIVLSTVPVIVLSRVAVISLSTIAVIVLSRVPVKALAFTGWGSIRSRGKE